jgi:hypothetical protein
MTEIKTEMPRSHFVVFGAIQIKSVDRGLSGRRFAGRQRRTWGDLTRGQIQDKGLGLKSEGIKNVIKVSLIAIRTECRKAIIGPLIGVTCMSGFCDKVVCGCRSRNPFELNGKVGTSLFVGIPELSAASRPVIWQGACFRWHRVQGNSVIRQPLVAWLTNIRVKIYWFRFWCDRNHERGSLLRDRVSALRMWGTFTVVTLSHNHAPSSDRSIGPPSEGSESEFARAAVLLAFFNRV